MGHVRGVAALQRLRPESKGLSLVTIVEFSIRSSIVIGIRDRLAIRETVCRVSCQNPNHKTVDTETIHARHT